MLFRLILGVFLLTAGGCSRQRTSVAVDAALLTQVPGDTVALGAMRVKALRSTAAWKKLLEQPQVNAQLEKLAVETSFDARKDLWEVLWSTNGKDTLVYARGEFAELGLEPKIDREGVQRLNYKGSMLLGNAENAVWFVNSSTAVYGKTETLHALIDGRGNGKPGPPVALRERIDKLPPNAHFWMVADAAAMPKLPEARGGGAMNVLQNLPMILRSVQMVTMDVSLTDGMFLEASAFCDGEQGAKQVHDSLRGIVGLARLTLPGPQKQALLPLLDAVEVVQKQTETTMRARLTVEQFENMQTALTAVAGKKAN